MAGGFILSPRENASTGRLLAKVASRQPPGDARSPRAHHLLRAPPLLSPVAAPPARRALQRIANVLCFSDGRVWGARVGANGAAARGRRSSVGAALAARESMALEVPPTYTPPVTKGAAIRRCRRRSRQVLHASPGSL